MKNMAFKIVDTWVLALHNSGPPGATWNDYVTSLKKDVVQRGIDPATVRTLVYTDGGGPNPAERKAYNTVMRGLGTAAIVTPSTFVRTIVTAFTLFTPRMKSFAPDAILDAFLYLKATRPEQEMLWQELRRLHSEVSESKLPEDYRRS
jgi:hypothetical protein